MKKKPEESRLREDRVAPSTYQSSKAELEEEFDVPDWSLDQMRENLLGAIRLAEDRNEPEKLWWCEREH